MRRVAYSNESGSAIVSAITRARCREANSSASASPGAFVTKPEVVFADEPTGNLDSKTKTEVMTMICAFAHDFNQTIVLVTHDPQMASYADRIVTLLDGSHHQRSAQHRPFPPNCSVHAVRPNHTNYTVHAVRP